MNGAPNIQRSSISALYVSLPTSPGPRNALFVEPPGAFLLRCRSPANTSSVPVPHRMRRRQEKRGQKDAQSKIDGLQKPGA